MRQIASILCVAAVSLAGCIPATKQIAGEATAIRGHTTAIIREMDAAERAKPKKAVLGHVKAAKVSAGAILDSVDAITEALPGVQDSPPGWYGLFRTGAWLVGIGLVVFACVYFGVGKLIRPIFQHFGRWLNRRAVRDVALDEKLLADKITMAEVVAARRGDKQYEKAYRKAKAANE